MARIPGLWKSIYSAELIERNVAKFNDEFFFFDPAEFVWDFTVETLKRTPIMKAGENSTKFSHRLENY
ncbi:MAG: hypothetical protein Ta2E_08740 [Mycoplasmoidaceae bacterium]|nr:MAG: hypothetical protein Ta2E_08740 [Mycoplasmoidaceae bacterium]